MFHDPVVYRNKLVRRILEEVMAQNPVCAEVYATLMVCTVDRILDLLEMALNNAMEKHGKATLTTRQARQILRAFLVYIVRYTRIRVKSHTRHDGSFSASQQDLEAEAHYAAQELLRHWREIGLGT